MLPYIFITKKKNIYIYIYIRRSVCFGLVWFYVISTIVGLGLDSSSLMAYQPS